MAMTDGRRATTTVSLLRPRRSERILDAGCGTGAHLGLMLRSGSLPVGLDLSRGMLKVTRAKHPSVPLAQADLNDRLPVRRRSFDAVLCALVGEHTVADYLNLIDRAGFRRIEVREFRGDDVLVEEVPWASKYLGRPLLLAVEARTS